MLTLIKKPLHLRLLLLLYAALVSVTGRAQLTVDSMSAKSVDFLSAKSVDSMSSGVEAPAYRRYLLQNRLYVCYSDSKKAFLVPDSMEHVHHGNSARMYVDDGNSMLSPQNVGVYAHDDSLYVMGQDSILRACRLYYYKNPTLKESLPAIDYTQPHDEVIEHKDVVYTYADGYWESCTDYSDDFSTIFNERIGALYQKQKLGLRLDVYEPKEKSSRPRPLLVMIHGGGFFYGDKAEIEYARWCRMFAECGYVAVSVNYRMGFFAYRAAIERAAYRALQDVNASIRYMLSHQKEYNINPDQIYLAGCSAGAITALNVAFMTESNRPSATRGIIFDKDLGTINSLLVYPPYHRPFKVRGICNMWGALFDLNMLYASRTPILSMHSRQDPIVPYAIGKPFSESLSELPSMSDGLIKSVLSGFIKEATGFVAPTMYGSSLIDRRAHTLGIKSELHSYDEPTHTLIYQPSGLLNDLHDEFFGMMTRFFQEAMVDHPVQIKKPSKGKRTYTIKNTLDIESCTWNVVGGIVTKAADSDRVNVAFFEDEPLHFVEVSGTYKAGNPFSVIVE